LIVLVGWVFDHLAAQLVDLNVLAGLGDLTDDLCCLPEAVLCLLPMERSLQVLPIANVSLVGLGWGVFFFFLFVVVVE
jgi:hypothetical protein